MSYLEFERGISSQQIQHRRKQQEAQKLKEDMSSRWLESERILSILRPVTSAAFKADCIEEWFKKVSCIPPIPHGFQEDKLNTPSGWFTARFPEQTNLFGCAFFEDTTVNIHGSTILHPSAINEDFFAAMLSGERRLGHRMIYLPGDGFWFNDSKLGAFCSTTDKKVEVLLSNYLIKCAERMNRNVNSRILVKDHRRPQVLAGIVARAKSVLEADSRFFEGAHAPLRHSQGRIIQPSVASSPEDFIHSAFVPRENAVVIVSEAYQKFLGHCQMENLIRVEFTEFKRVARDLVLEKFQLGLRHDIRTPEGRQTHGWKHLCLVPELTAPIANAA